jgi:hypothetical protein
MKSKILVSLTALPMFLNALTPAPGTEVRRLYMAAWTAVSQ